MGDVPPPESDQIHTSQTVRAHERAFSGGRDSRGLKRSRTCPDVYFTNDAASHTQGHSGGVMMQQTSASKQEKGG
uniref:Uncharacterized protein n=1 Tax=Mesocestoides corti TaxID=53468 RepID=A0A5K3EP43_MESCO